MRRVFIAIILLSATISTASVDWQWTSGQQFPTSATTQYTVIVVTETTRSYAYTNSQFVVLGQSGSGPCRFLWGQFKANGGQEFAGSVISTSPVDFFVMDQNQFSRLESTKCSETPNALLTATNVTNYNFDWFAPQTGLYYFIFTNHLRADVSVTFNEWTAETSAHFESVAVTVASSNFLQTNYEFLHGKNGLLVAGVILFVLLSIALVAFRRRLKENKRGTEIWLEDRRWGETKVLGEAEGTEIFREKTRKKKKS